MAFKGRLLTKKNLLIAITCYAMYCIWNVTWHANTTPNIIVYSPDTKRTATKFIIDTKGCRIPDMNPFDTSIRDCLFNPVPIVCDKDGRGMLVKSSGNKLYVDTTILSNFGLTEENVTCCYQPFWYKFKEDYVKSRVRWKKMYFKGIIMRYNALCTLFTNAVIEDEFVLVKCILPNNTMYRDRFIFVKERGKYLGREKDGKLDVLIIGFDSVSRLNFHRQMPKTEKYLRELDAVEMFGFNRVGFNTYANVIPLLTGQPAAELENKLYPMIWNTYRRNGFLTGLGEDLETFRGFSFYGNYGKAPTDFNYNLYLETTKLFHERRSNYDLCFGKRLALDVLLDAIKQFMIKSKNIPKFGFFWSTSISHDYTNLLSYADDYYHSFLKYFYDNGIFNRSIVILLSDHGIRWGCVRRTYQGYMEENLPYLFIKYPTWFPDKYPKAVENLKANARRLISPYDLYKTLEDLIDLKNITDSQLDNRLYDEQSTLGTSLFLPINESRTCNDAGIPDVFCACNPSEPITLNSEKVKISAESIVTYLNDLLKNSSQCSKLYVEKIMNARLERTTLSDNYGPWNIFEDYIVTVKARPSLAYFEGYVRYDPLMRNHSVLPPVMRITLYGNESYCIEDQMLKYYCYCN